VTNIDSDETLIDCMCGQFEQCDCLEALETCLVPLQMDIADKQEYTLVPGALDRMRAVYKKRLGELTGDNACNHMVAACDSPFQKRMNGDSCALHCSTVHYAKVC